MNPDLKLRLTPFLQTTTIENRFFWWLMQQLSIDAAEHADQRGYEITVTTRKIDDPGEDTGYVDGDGQQFHIHLDERMSFGTVVDYLIHELAHVHSWHYYEADPHGDEFGKSWAFLYRQYLKYYDLYREIHR